MASAKPVIAIDWGGPSDYIDPTCGVLLPATDPTTLTRDLENAIFKLASSPELCRKMGEEGRKKVEAQYSWPVKIEQLVSIYREAVNAGTKMHRLAGAKIHQ